MIARVILGFILLFDTVALAESQVPPINPSITGTLPHGGQRGQEIEVTLQGRNLQNTQSIHFKSAKLKAMVVSSDAYTVKARIRVDSNAEPGRHDLRLTASHGQRSDILMFPTSLRPGNPSRTMNQKKRNSFASLLS